MFKSGFYLIVISVGILISSCGGPDDAAFNENKKKDSVQSSVDSIKNIPKDITQFSDKQGVVGIFNVPEMLTISKIDSAPMKDISFKMAKSYSVLQEQLNTLEVKIDGSYGCIYYNNNPNNFIFECIVPINKMPKKEPRNCKIVVLEADKMLIYNFYGPYQNLFASYDIIRKYLAKNKLKQVGPMREFYITDPTLEKDPLKWLTRIMVPVTEVK
ncbi:MAG: GyrI-like domain-containing protein [Bacteroidota bacterium]|nr:GyrI-like domain-containing protein [Bacteroidota bacterium]